VSDVVAAHDDQGKVRPGGKGRRNLLGEVGRLRTGLGDDGEPDRPLGDLGQSGGQQCSRRLVRRADPEPGG
jgi:hypothetical protein